MRAMFRPVAALLLTASCVSIGGSARFHHAVTDSPVRRGAGQVQVGTFTEIVQDEAIGTLFYSRDVGPLGERSEALGAWGARLSTLSRGTRPGLYLSGAYGQNDDATQPRATSYIGGAGITYGTAKQGVRGRAFGGASLGLVVHRQRQETVDQNQIGWFVGIELGFLAAFDLFGPLYATPDE